MNPAAAEISASLIEPIDPSSSKSRMPALDCLRGLMLAIVLGDHIDGVTYGSASIAEWTLTGLGFSDAADGFVFISGFVFGYAYGKRVRRDGRWSSLKHGLFRVLQIYIGFMLCCVAVGLLKVSVGLSDWKTQCSQWLYCSCLCNQPLNTSILCLYIVMLPWLLLLFLTLSDRLWWIVLGGSFAMYITAQFAASSGLQLPKGWPFQPLAWQFPMVLSAILGRQLRTRGTLGLPRSQILFVSALSILLLGLAVKKSAAFPFEWLNYPQLSSQQLIGKSNWAPLRAMHHLSLVYATVFLLPLSNAIWSSRLLEPFRVCGRHSLTIYCVGVTLTEIASIVALWVGNLPAIVTLLVFDALALQCATAYLLDRVKPTLSAAFKSEKVGINPGT